MYRVPWLFAVFVSGVSLGCTFDGSGFARPDHADAGSQPDATAPPADYAPIVDHPGLYRGIVTPVSAAAAAIDCSDDAVGTRLVVIDHAAENRAVRRFADEHLGGSRIWLGISDLVAEGTWITVDEHVVDYVDWKPNEPNDWAGEDCVVVLGADDPLDQRGRWNDVDCEEAHSFVCEWNPSS